MQQYKSRELQDFIDSNKKVRMKQKREQFHKQIRRQALQKIFRQKRQQLFNYKNPQNHHHQNQQKLYEQLTLRSHNQLTRYSQQLNQALCTQNFEVLVQAIKESYFQIKQILNKGKQCKNIEKRVGQNWFKYGFDRLLINVIQMFQKTHKNSFIAIRKEAYRYSMMHFFTILKHHDLIGAQVSRKEIFHFLFCIIVELSNLPQSINQVMLTVNFLLSESQEMRHQFLFQNYQIQSEGNQGLLSFENLIYVMFQNREKFSQRNNESQEERSAYRDIKMNFISLFIQYGYELKDMEKYIQSCRKNGAEQNNNNNSSVLDRVYEESLKLHKFPSQIKLKHFLQKQTLTIVIEIISEMRKYYLNNWSNSGQNQQNLVDCIEASRFLIDYIQNYKIINSLEDQLGQIISLLTIKSMNIQVKNEAICLIDTIIFFDEDNVATDFMVKNHNLFEKLWSFEEPSQFSIKMNIVNNLLLCTSGFHAINRHLSEIVITLHETSKFIALALTFINNYFIQTKYDLHPKSRVDLLISLLYSLPGESYTVQNLQIQFYILSHLYDNGFSRLLPERYEEWKIKLMSRSLDFESEKVSQNQFFQIINKIFDIYSHYSKQQAHQFMDYD